MPRETIRKIWENLRPFRLDWIQVEVSGLCVGRCRFCPVPQAPGSGQGNLMEPETFARLLPSLPAADMVHLQGWGEPLLHPDFWAMARQVAEAGPRVGFTTNGVLLNREHRWALLESPVEVVGVSLAGATPSTHDRFRQGCPFHLLDENLRALKGEREGAGLDGPHLHLVFLLMRGNLHELPEVVELARRWGAHQVVASHLSLILDREMDGQSVLANPEIRTRAREAIREARSRAAGEAPPRTQSGGRARAASGERAGDPGPFRGAMDEEGKEEGAEISGQEVAFHAYGWDLEGPLPSCPENVLRSCFVSASGQVSPCVMTSGGLARGEEGLSHRFRGTAAPLETLVLGNLREASLEEIWRLAPARDFRRIFRDRIWRGTRGGEGLPGPCRRCYKLFEV